MNVLLVVYGWSTIIIAFSLFKLCNSTTIREVSESIQQVATLVSTCIKKKEYDVDYTTLVMFEL